MHPEQTLRGGAPCRSASHWLRAMPLVALMVSLMMGCTTTAPTSSGAVALSGRAQQSFNAAVEAMQAERWTDAEILLQPLVAEQPDLAGAWLNLGIVYAALARDAEAEQALRSALKADPGRMDAVNRLGLALREQGRFEEARKLYVDALERNPDHAETHRNLGILYDLYLGQAAQALTHYQRYQSLQGETPDRQVAGWVVDLERRL